MSYVNENDNEYMYMISENDENASNELINKYKYIIDNIVRYNIDYASSAGLDEKDLYQEGLLGLMHAIDNYDESKDVKFYTYAFKCIETKIRSYIRSSLRQKNKYLNESLSLDSLLPDEKQDYYAVLKDEESDPYKQISSKEEALLEKQKLYELLTPFEKEVFELKLKGHTNPEISSLLQKEKRSIENTLTRIKIKYKSIL